MKLRLLSFTWISLLTLWFAASPVHAADVVVGSGTPGSCDEAAFNFALSQALSSNGTLIFNCGAAPHTITFTQTKHITSSITIDGGDLITLSGNSLITVLEIEDDVPLLTLKNLTIADGKASPAVPYGVCRSNACGGGVRGHFRASLTVINCTFRNNQANATALVRLTSLDYGGGAIYLHTGVLTVQNSQFINNHVQNGSGGAIHLLHSNAFISDTTFDSNSTNYYGGAIYTDGTINDGAGITTNGILQFTRVTFSNNTSLGQGGAVFNYLYINRQTNILAEYRDVRFFNNSVNPDLLVKDAYGGALRIGNGPARIYNTTFSGNTAKKQGGALWTGEAASVALWNSTFYNNDAVGVNSSDGYGGAMYVASSGLFSLTSATVANNHAGQFGGGIWSKGSNVSLINDIFSNNTATNPWGVSQHCDRTYGSARNNIQWPALAGDTRCGAVKFADPLLAAPPPTINEGFTETMALQNGSPAIDAGDSAYCLEADQRGRFRTFDGNWDGKGLCDIGAYEFVSFNVPSAPNAPPYRNVFTTAGATLTWNRVASAASYEIQIDNNYNFSSVNQDAIVSADTLSLVTDSFQEGVYYWRVRARDASNHWGAWSTPDSFLMTP